MSVENQTAGTIGTGRRRWQARSGAVHLAPSVPAPKLLTVPAKPTDVEIDLSRAALVIIDMQNDFCHPNGWLSSTGVDVSPDRRPIPSLAAGIPALRAVGVPIVWVDWGTRPDRRNLPPNVIHIYDPDGSGVGIGSTEPTGAPVLERGSWGAAIVDELAAVGEPTDIYIDKHRISGFWDTELDSVLRNLDVTTILFAGVNADQCVMATLIDAACIGYDSIFLEDASATTSPQFCWDATIYNVHQCFGFTANLSEITSMLTDVAQ